ncbi:MAG: hypothetical protein WA145_13040 [Pseudomonas sp.]
MGIALLNPSYELGRDIPVVGLIGGGYGKDRHALARRHGILHHSAAKVWQARGLG